MWFFILFLATPCCVIGFISTLQAVEKSCRGQAEFVIWHLMSILWRFCYIFHFCAKVRMFPTLSSNPSKPSAVLVPSAYQTSLPVWPKMRDIKSNLKSSPFNRKLKSISIGNIYLFSYKKLHGTFEFILFLFTIVASYRVIWRYLVSGSIFPANVLCFFAFSRLYVCIACTKVGD